jgi:subtilisin family serine protease
MFRLPSSKVRLAATVLSLLLGAPPAGATWRGGEPLAVVPRALDHLIGSPAEREMRALGQAKTHLGPPEQKVDFHLRSLRWFTSLQEPIRVSLHLSSTTPHDLAALRASGFELEIMHVPGGRAEGQLRAQALRSLASLPFVTAVRPALRGWLRVGSVTSEGDIASRADLVRAQGYDGTGIIVGVISDGIDSIAAANASGDVLDVAVPSDPRCHRGSGDEGTALLEVVHDLAPGARLLFASGIESTLGFVDAVACLSAAGANVLLDDIGFFDEPFFEDGVVASEVRRAARGGVSYHTAAGNEAEAHLEQFYRPSGTTNLHDFLGGPVDTTNDIRIAPFGAVTCVLQWNDPFGASSNDYDLFLLDDSLHVLDASTNVQNGTQDPFEFVVGFNPTQFVKTVKVAIAKSAGDARLLKMFCLGGQAQEYVTPSGSIVGHAAIAESVSVGAIDVADPGLDDVEFFSSRGPARILFPRMEVRSKPDLVAFDGVSISNAGGFPLCPSECRFFGTSAAVPHSAAIAALMLNKNPFLSPTQVQQMLKATAVDIGPPGPDESAGAGRIDALAAVSAVPAPECVSDGDCDDHDACTTDTCDRGTCMHSPIVCGEITPEQCADNRCVPALGCRPVSLGGYAGVVCWVRSVASTLRLATPVAVAPRVQQRLLRLTGLADAKIAAAVAAERTGRIRRTLDRRRSIKSLLNRMDRITKSADHQAQMLHSMVEKIGNQLARARTILRQLARPGHQVQ